MNPRAKLALAIVAAAGTVGLASYVGYSSMGGARTVRSASDAAREDSPPPGTPAGEGEPGERRVEIGGPPPAWVERERARDYESGGYEFPDADEVSDVFDAGVEYLAMRAEQAADLGPLGTVARRGLIEAWNAFLRPLILGDKAGFADAVADLGGDVSRPEDAPDAAPPSDVLYDRLAVFFEGARVDLAASEIIGRDGTDPRQVPLGAPRVAGMPGGGEGARVIPMMVNVERFEDDATGETRELRTMNVPLASLFPDAALLASEGAPTFEVWAPAKFGKSRGSGADIGPSAFFVLDRETSRWQPVALRVTLASESAKERLGQLMANRRRSTD